MGNDAGATTPLVAVLASSDLHALQRETIRAAAVGPAASDATAATEEGEAMNRAILVKSCRRFRARQYACWEAWGGQLAHSAFVRILVGRYDCFIDTPFVYGVDCRDDCEDNSIKLKKGIRWFLYTHDFTHLFICDDDTFIHPPRWLAHEPAGECEGRLYRPTPEQAKRHGEAPWLHGGAGWWMSRRLCELYVEHCHERTSGDDIIAARIAQQHGIEIHDRPDLYGDSRYSQPPCEMVAAGNTLITCHPVQPAEMAKLWEQVRGV